MLDQKKRTLKRLGIAGVATAMTTMGIPGIAGAATLRVAPDAVANATATPSAPTTLKATDVGAGKVMLSWTAPSGTVSGYNVYVGTVSGGEATTPANGDVLVHGTTYTVTDSVPGTALTAGGTYYFTVAAVNAAGQGSLSVEANATASAVAPSAPGNVTATPSAGAVTVSWSAPTTGDTPTYYTVSYGTSSTSMTSSVEVQGTSTAAPATMAYISGLSDGTAYYFDVTATNSAGTSSASSTVSATPNTGLVPPPPTITSATGNDGSITIDWAEQDASANGVSGYNVYEGSSSGGESTTPVNGSVPITGTTTTVSATNGTTEYFTVKAVNSVGMSAASAEASATAGVTVNAAPSAPQFVAATALNGAAKLTWKAPASSGDSKVDNYKVLESSTTSASGSFASANLSGSATTHSTSSTSATVTSLTSTGHYYFEVVAENAAGHSSVDSSPTSEVFPDVNSAPESPSGLTVSTSPATTGTANKLSWTAPVYTGGGTYGYHVYRGTTEIATVKSTAATSFVDSAAGDKAPATGVTYSPGYTAPASGTKYSYKVTAFDNYGASSADGPVSITTGDVTPAAPTSLTATVTANNTVKLGWAAPTDQGSGNLEYKVIERDNTTGFTTSPTTTATGSPYSATTSPGNNYTFTVEAESTATGTGTAVLGTSGPSNAATVTSTVTPAAPTGLSASAVGAKAVKLTWNQPGGAAAPTKYEIFDGTSSTAIITPVGTIGTSTSFTVTGLTAGTKYYFDVEAANGSNGTSGPSNIASATPTATSTTAAPGAPTALAATVEGGLVNLSWTKPSSSGSSPLLNYEVFSSATTFGAAAREIGSTSGTGTAAVLDELTPGAPVDLYVKAVNSSGLTSGYSAPVEVTPSSSVSRPSAPGRPVATSNGAGRALVVWTAPSTVGESAIHGYFVTAHLVNGKGKTIFVSGTTTSATVGGLMEGGTYYFTVVAVNAVGGGTPSAPSTFIKVSGVATKVFVTPPAMLNAPGTAMIRVTVNMPTARVQLFDEANGKNFFFSKAIKETTPSKYGNGVAEFLVNIDATNHFYVMVNGVKSNVVTAMVK